MLGLTDVFGVGPLISFISIQFIVVQLRPNLFKYLAITVSGARHTDMLRVWRRP